MTYTIGELFAGIGGVTGGLLDAGGFEPVVLLDNDEIAAKVFRSNFPEYKSKYKTRKINGSITGRTFLDMAGGSIDGLLGCPPCQGLSAAGLRDASDARNGLLFEMLRLIKAVQPRFFIMENVPALLRSSLFKEFSHAVSSTYEVCAETVNAAEYGVPQLRRRAVIIGFQKALGVKPTLPAASHGGSGNVFDYCRGSRVSPATSEGRNALNLRPLISRSAGAFTPPDKALVTLWDALSDLPVRALRRKRKTPPLAIVESMEYAFAPRSEFQRAIRRSSDVVLNHIAWDHGEDVVDGLRRTMAGDCPKEGGGRSRNTKYFSQAYARLHPEGLARTITTNFHNPGGGRFTHYSTPRTLTLREALRVQGFPDTFYFESVYGTDARRLVGNAFPRILAAAIGTHVKNLLK